MLVIALQRQRANSRLELSFWDEQNWSEVGQFSECIFQEKDICPAIIEGDEPP